MNNSNFLGASANRDGADLPIGLGMQLVQNSQAMSAFGAMTMMEREALIRHIQGATSGEDAKTRIADAIDRLNSGQTSF